MHKLRIYIDTSVIGGCFDEEFAEWSNQLFDEFIEGKKIAVISDIIIDELSRASVKVREKIKEIPDEYIEIVMRTDETVQLAKSYIESDALSNKSTDDALHIAAATIARVDVLASWNFKHIVNLRRIQIFNSVNMINGFQMIEIRSPREVL